MLINFLFAAVAPARGRFMTLYISWWGLVSGGVGLPLTRVGAAASRCRIVAGWWWLVLVAALRVSGRD